MNNNYYQTIDQYLNAADNIFLFHHKFPDGDCLGSKYGLGELIKLNYPNKKVFYLGSVDGLYPFLSWPVDQWDQLPEEAFANSLAIIVDGDCTNRVLASEYLWSKKFTKLLRIDHHDTVADIPYDYQWIDASMTAAAEQIAVLAIKLNWTANQAAANYLYLGIHTDSGRMAFERTNARTFQTLKYLAAHGLNIFWMNQHLAQRSENFTRFSAYVWKNYQIKGEFIYCVVSLATITQFNLNVVEANDANLIANLIGTKAWAFFIELPNGKWRIRLRSSQIDVSNFLVPFGGSGGQRFSTALTFEKDQMNSIIDHIVQAIKNYDHD